MHKKELNRVNILCILKKTSRPILTPLCTNYCEPQFCQALISKNNVSLVYIIWALLISHLQIVDLNKTRQKHNEENVTNSNDDPESGNTLMRKPK